MTEEQLSFLAIGDQVRRRGDTGRYQLTARIAWDPLTQQHQPHPNGQPIFRRVDERGTYGRPHAFEAEEIEREKPCGTTPPAPSAPKHGVQSARSEPNTEPATAAPDHASTASTSSNPTTNKKQPDPPNPPSKGNSSDDRQGRQERQVKPKPHLASPSEARPKKSSKSKRPTP